MRRNDLPVKNEDLLVRQLRTQISALDHVLQDLETGIVLDEYFDESLKRVEKELKELRKMAAHN